MRVGAYSLAMATLAAAVVVTGRMEGSSTPARMPLRDLPYILAGWTGRSEVADPNVLARTRPDEALQRRYIDFRGREIFLYIGYYARGAARAQTLALCSGECTVVEAAREDLEAGGRVVTVNRADVVQDGGLAVVLYWYQHGRRLIADPYRGKLEQVRRALVERRTDGALVRISAPVIASAYEARERDIAFARALLPVLESYLPE